MVVSEVNVIQVLRHAFQRALPEASIDGRIRDHIKISHFVRNLKKVSIIKSQKSISTLFICIGAIPVTHSGVWSGFIER